jgi:hypothetical protein
MDLYSAASPFLKLREQDDLGHDSRRPQYPARLFICQASPNTCWATHCTVLDFGLTDWAGRENDRQTAREPERRTGVVGGKSRSVSYKPSDRCETGEGSNTLDYGRAMCSRKISPARRCPAMTDPVTISCEWHLNHGTVKERPS